MTAQSPVVPKQPILQRKGVKRAGVLFAGALAGAAVTAQIAPATPPPPSAGQSTPQAAAVAPATAPAPTNSSPAQGKSGPPPPLTTAATPPNPVPLLPPEPGPPAAGSWRWTVRIDMFLRTAAAQAAAELLAAAGVDAKVSTASGTGGRIWSLVTVGDFATGAEAATAAVALSGKFDYPMIAVPIPPHPQQEKPESSATPG